MRTILGFVLVSLLLPVEGRAQGIDGSFRLALDTTVLVHDGVTLSDDAGVVADTKAARTEIGLSAAALGIGLGYGASENFLLGGRLRASTTHSKLAEIDSDMSSISVLPYAEYVLSGGPAQPFLAMNIGYAASSSSGGGADASTSSWLIGPAVGVHYFAAPSFSVDIGLQALFDKGTSSVGGTSLATSGYSVALTVGLSGWLGIGVPTGTTPVAVREEALGEPPSQDTSVLQSNFTLDLPDATGGVQVAIQGDAKTDAERARVVVTWRRLQKGRAECGPAALELATLTIPFANVRSAARGGFGSAMVSQQGLLPIESLALVDPTKEAWLVLCDERVVILPAAKRRVRRFVDAFQASLTRVDRP